jgi:serine/threonine protein kinase
MEYNEYSDIDKFKKKIIKRQVLSETLICYIAGGIGEALLYLASKKIIHMDIKQQNVLMDDFLNVRLTDYSISLKYDINKEKIQLKQEGTCYYMSPEVIEKKSIDVCDASKIDVYSFGVLLYFLAFHDYPYQLDKVDTQNYSGILKQIKEEKLVFPEGTGHSKLFKNFVSKCLEKDIKKRYNIYQVMNDPWIKAYQIIQNEKENLVNAEKFLVELMVDNIKNFNDYIKEKENES